MDRPSSPSSAERRGAIDVARVGALVVVVAGHLLLAVIDRGPNGSLRGANVLSLHPHLAWLTVIAPMPVFFAAAGWANSAATLESAAPRLRSLVGVGAVVVVLWCAPVIVQQLVAPGTGASGRGVLGDGARIATQPLWFLAAYVPFTALGSTLAVWARRPVRTVAICLAVLAVLDAARFGLGASEVIGWPGFLIAWAVPWVLGSWWRDRWSNARWQAVTERRFGVLLALGGIAAGAVLVVAGGYSAGLIDVVAGRRSNTTPPTLFTAVAATAQVGVLIVAATVFDRIAARWAGPVRRAGTIAVGVYVWHLSALALCAGVVALGVSVPRRLTGWWWATRPLWWAAVLAVTAALVFATTAVTKSATRARVGRRRRSPVTTRLTVGRRWFGVWVAAFGAAAIGLKGPSTIWLALGECAAFVLGWWCLGPPAPAPAPTQTATQTPVQQR